jgi:glycosyltransferase involved in cell wall biosynthesis
MSLPLSVVILTLNEAMNLPRCLAALPAGIEVIVVDSGSTDGTPEMAANLGAKVLIHPFASFGVQRNWAIDSAGASQPWILFLDADEEATPAFWDQLGNLIQRDSDGRLAGVFCCWKMMLRGRWLKRSDSFPKWQLRLLRRGRVRFVDAGHGQKEGEVNGETAYLTEPYLHHAFSKGWTDWLTRHNRYSTQEAVARLAAGAGSWRQAFKASGSERNKRLKPLVSRLPFWPVVRFLHDYLWRGGVLEGREGLDYALLMAIYEYLICLKMRDADTPI